jgi:hypothetical protein
MCTYTLAKYNHVPNILIIMQSMFVSTKKALKRMRGLHELAMLFRQQVKKLHKKTNISS